MTLDKAKEYIQTQLDFGSGYNRNAIRVLLAEIQREHGQDATDKLIRDMNLEEKLDLPPGTDFSKVM